MTLPFIFFPQFRSYSNIALLAYFVTVVLLANTTVDSAYMVVDTVHCVNIMDLLLLQPGIDHSFDLRGTQLRYDLTSIPVTDHSLFHISQPQFSLSPDVHDFPEEQAANQRNSILMRQYQLETAKFFPNTRIVLFMLIPVKFEAASSSASQLFYNLSLKQSIATMLRTRDLEGALVRNAVTTTTIFKECFWTTLQESLIGMEQFACIVTVTHNRCTYAPYDKIMLQNSGYMQWVLDLEAMMSGLGNMWFKIDFEYLHNQSHPLNACDTVLVAGQIALLKNFPFKHCRGLSIVVECTSAGVPCTLSQMESNVQKLWEVVSVFDGTPVSLSTIQEIIPLLSTPGKYKIMYDRINIARGVHMTLSDAYFDMDTKRECGIGRAPRRMLLKENGYVYETSCTPCPINTYYEEQKTLRSSTTENINKSKTLFLRLHSQENRDATTGLLVTQHAYHLSDQPTRSNTRISMQEQRAFSFPVQSGTNVTVIIDSELLVERIRVSSTMWHRLTDNPLDQSTTLSIIIPNIYGEDDDDADLPIFIDVRPRPTSPAIQNVMNQHLLAILPLRHRLQQVCTMCPDDYVTFGYASVGREACVAFEGAQRATPAAVSSSVGSSTTPAVSPSVSTTMGVDDRSGPLFLAIAGYQLREIQYSRDATQFKMFLESDAISIFRRISTIMMDAETLFNVNKTARNISFEFVQIDDVLSAGVPGSLRRRLLTAERVGVLPIIDMVSVTVKVHRQGQSLTSKPGGWYFFSFFVEFSYFTVGRILQFSFIFTAIIVMCVAYYWLQNHFSKQNYDSVLQALDPPHGSGSLL